ncbi:hypothetical protein ADICYQ_3616 [Cyclobacterium qasimii M12-11B]|uniref:Uncharacterized protein n=1 Tax=Cyclobacterium qasimii M12-11B TaxID=641524 RepID=S7WTB7_9BACT|nr:hypothetical protein ADICYQ_3616 [Cyclobacterium qasimii M12-11B]
MFLDFIKAVKGIDPKEKASKSRLIKGITSLLFEAYLPIVRD